MLINLKEEKYEELVKEGLVVVDFYATWCGPCKMIGPVLEELSQELEIKVVKVDVDEHLEIARKFAIMSVPTILIYKNNEIVDKLIGFMPKDELKEKIMKNL